MKPHISTPGVTRQFTQLLSVTPRGVRLARLLAAQQLAEWGWPPSCTARESAAVVVAEPAANAVTHGRVKDRCFRLGLVVEAPNTLRVEVADPRGERRPQPRTTTVPGPDPDESGRGPVLVDALAPRWGTEPRPPSGKTVWACLPLT
ncbi:ATP-binding protein [Streptomyces macrosporus]